MNATSTRRTLIASTVSLIAGVVAARIRAQSGTPGSTPAASAAASPMASPTAGAMVAIKDFAFDPQTIEIAVGDSVTWVQEDLLGHTATAVDGSFGSDVLARGETFTVTFDNVGNVEYICALHVQMTGTVVVSR